MEKQVVATTNINSAEKGRRIGLRLPRASLILAATSLTASVLSVPAQAETVGACTGVTLPRSVVTDILGSVLVPVLGPVESLLGGLTFGSVNLGLTGALSSAASGAPINLGAIDINGGTVDLLTDPGCTSQADSFTLGTPRGLSIGGNSITGLGQTGLGASAGELDAIAIGDLASTGVGANRAIALGAGALVSHAGSVALGAGSIANGSNLGNPAYLVGGTAAAEVNIGSRRITGLSAGADATDAVNVAQLTAVNSAVTQVGADLSVLDGVAVKYQDSTQTAVAFGGTSGTRLSNVAAGIADSDAANIGQLNTVSTAVTTLANSVVSYDSSTRDLVTLQGASGTRIANVAAGAVNATSTDAVNGAQLHTTNSNVAQLGTDLSVLDGVAVKYQDSTQAAVAFGGTSGTRLSNVAAGIADSDAANIGQLNTVSTAVTTLANSAVSYDSSTRDLVTLQGASGTRIANVAAGAVNATSTDAINGAQLHSTNTNVAQLSLDLSVLDSASVKYQDGTRTAVTFGGVSGTRLSNVAAGVAQDDAVTMGQLAALATTVDGVQQDSLRYDSVTNTYNATRAGVPTRISGVAAGALDSQSSDAVNGAQLAATNATVTRNGDSITRIDQQFAALDTLAVKYQDSSRSAITLGGASGTRIANVAAGVQDGDAVNVAQLNAVSTDVGSVRDEALLYDTAANAYHAARGGTDQRITGVATGTVAAGSSDAVNGAQLAQTNDAVARSAQRTDAATASIATHLGGGATVQADGSISAPSYALATVGTDGTRGTANYASVGDALDGLGNSVANVSQRIDGVAAVSERAVSYDGAPGQARDTVTFAGSEGTRLANVRAGEISATSTDAVTGAQLHTTNTQLASNTTVINALRYGTDGYVQVNNSAAFAKPAATGADSIAAGAGAISSADRSTAIGTQAQASAINSVAVGYGSIADRANSLSVGNAGAERQITNVADGSAPADAVNMRQLADSMGSGILTANAYTDRRFEQIGQNIHSLRRDAEAGTASSMALSALPQPIESGRGMLGMGTSVWQGETAVAVGFSRASDDGRLILKAGATYNSRKQGGANAGFGLAF